MIRPTALAVFALVLWASPAWPDYFQWILEVYPEGVYRRSERKLVDEKTEFKSRGWTCTVENAWRDNTAWLLLEGKSLVCQKTGEAAEKRVDLVCTEHDPAVQKRSRPVQRAGLYLDESRAQTTPFLRLGCQTVVQRLF